MKASDITIKMPNIEKAYWKALKELENYARYMLRCLHRVGIHPTPADIIHVTFERNNGQIAEAVTYPRSSGIDGVGVVNPMFFYGFKMDLDFRDLDHVGINVSFCDNFEDLKF